MIKNNQLMNYYDVLFLKKDLVVITLVLDDWSRIKK